jgi:SAM-dependent methyltransferase
VAGSDVNRQTYGSVPVVAEYARDTELQPPERAILDELRPQLGGWRVRDLGVGAGRTTLHLSGEVGSYVGLDYAAGMVATCRQRFGDGAGPALLVADGRALPLRSGAFDFVLFSFNGLDDIPAADRQRVVEEIHRVGRPGGMVCFSAHNLQALDQRRLGLRRQLSRNPRRLARNLLKWLRLRLVHNRHLYRGRLDRLDATQVYDHNHGQFMPTHYIRPAAQLRQLDGQLTGVRVFGQGGTAQADPPEQERAAHRWR